MCVLCICHVILSKFHKSQGCIKWLWWNYSLNTIDERFDHFYLFSHPMQVIKLSSCSKLGNRISIEKFICNDLSILLHQLSLDFLPYLQTKTLVMIVFLVETTTRIASAFSLYIAVCHSITCHKFQCGNEAIWMFSHEIVLAIIIRCSF